jgi:hypothetical protein
MNGTETYLCPLTCDERFSAAALSGHLRMHAGRLSDETRALYARLDIPAVHADKAELETLSRMAYAYGAVTGEWPAWKPLHAETYATPEWV